MSPLVRTLICASAGLLVLGLVTSAGAESGWYLMGPPWDGQLARDTTKPLSTWEQLGTFGSIQECKAEQRRLILWAEAGLLKMPFNVVPTDPIERRPPVKRRRLDWLDWVWIAIYFGVVYAAGSDNGGDQWILGLFGGFMVGYWIKEGEPWIGPRHAWHLRVIPCSLSYALSGTC